MPVASADSNNFLQAAVAYAVRGWAVFPLSGKLPAISKENGGSGYLDADTDSAQIRRWWAKYPRANIGIATRASQLLVLDVDPRHGGDERLEALEEEHGRLPHTAEVITGSGGRHIYFKAPADDVIQRRADALGPGLDLPNYVVAPPSIHPNTGRPYQWEANSHPDTALISATPAWLLELATSSLKAPNPQHIVRTGPPPGWLALVYEAIIARIEAEGGRLRPDGNGGMKGRCPLHRDRNPSFSIHPQKGWKCFSGCGEGRLTSLAVKLDIEIVRG